MTTYLRPTAFVDAPFGLDGQVARLAGGLLWFSAVEWIETQAGRRILANWCPSPPSGTA
jgi:dihydropteroate synthase